ncbi:NAD-dependent epimerase/dehydratase family protein [Pseudonocardia sichuanensis]
MDVVVAGASGALGTVLVPQLVATGHTVTGLSRSPSGLARIRAAGARAVRADLLDEPGLLRALADVRADAVVHQATALERTPTRHRHLHATNALRDRGTAHLLRCAAQIGARRFVTQSFFLGYGYRDHGSAPVTEDRPFGELTGDAFDVHLRSMRANEDQVLGATGVEGIALRYGLFYGSDRSTAALLDLARRRRLPAPAPAGVTSPVHLEDAAAATVAALERGRPGQAYNVVDDHPVGFDEFVDALAAAVGAPPPRRVPAWVLRPLPYLHALMARTRIRVSNAKAREELDWAPRHPSCHEGLAEVAAAQA